MIKRSQVLRYALLPGFIPRITGIFSTGFVHAAYLLAIIYESLRLLPPNHPYLNRQNMGRYGLRHVIAEAANNLVISRKNIDQVIVFFTTLAGVVLLLSQFVLLIVALVAQQPALAGGYPTDTLVPLKDIFLTTSTYNKGPSQDIAFIILDRVFGMKAIFESCISQIGVDCENLRGTPMSTPSTYPFPFHKALHAMLQFYSVGMFIISVFIILYFVAAIVGETAATGTPFGQRFNKAWAPVRLIVFFALLVPLNVGANTSNLKSAPGINGAQIITFWTAKFGSNFATNAWGRFNSVITETFAGNPNQLVATPNTPEINSLLQFMFVTKTCQIAENLTYKKEHDDDIGGNKKLDQVQAYLVREKQPAGQQILPGDDFADFGTTSFKIAKDFVNYGNITIRFGVRDPDNEDYKNFKGNVFPFCGDIKLFVGDLDETSGSYAVQELYYNLLKDMWLDSAPGIDAMKPPAECIFKRTSSKYQDTNCTLPDKNFAQAQISAWQNEIDSRMTALIQQQKDNGNWNVTNVLQEKGWAGAAIWYNRIAELNGEVATAVSNLPQPEKYGVIMEAIAESKRAENENINPLSVFDPKADIDHHREQADEEIAPAMAAAYNFWAKTDETTSDNPFIDTVNFLFGTSGIFEMRENTDIHPLAQLSALGKGMMEAAVRNLAFGIAGSPLSKLLGKNAVGELASHAGSFFKTIGMTTMAMSFVLFYVLPFLPFIYFIFAVSGWVKSIFEAIVAMPLWALAHIRIDGEGLPGRDASNGYFLLLEIFLRPILIVFGLLGSITIFSALVTVLNQVFDTVLLNVSGFDRQGEADGSLLSSLESLRGPVDEFFFTAMYVIICYLIGLSCFKLIDLIPNQILRWAGVTVSTFQENAGDPAGEAISKTYHGGLLLTNQLKGGQLATIM